ncbi:unnamed protein product, partial [marine sediment metagenome]
MRQYKIAIIIGTRAELIKTFTVMLELQRREIPYYFIHTGQHNLGDLCKMFGVKEPDEILTKEPKKSTKFYSKIKKALLWNIRIVFKIRSVLKRILGLEYVMYHGDTMTTASASIASSRLLNPFKKYQNIHLEAGLRSDNIREPFPEEIARRIADRFSDILLTVSDRSTGNVQGRFNTRVIQVGNTIADSARVALMYAVNKRTNPLTKEKFALITVHRHENIK